jgi:hypothetical protein
MDYSNSHPRCIPVPGGITQIERINTVPRFQIKCNASTRFPAQHICLQMSTDVSELEGFPGTTREEFKAVAARRFRQYADRMTRVQDAYHEDMSSWWEWFYEQLNPKLGTWIWCNDFKKHFELLGIMAQLDCGKLKYKGSYVAPNCAYLKCDSDQGSCTWLEMKNWFQCDLDQMLLASQSAITAYQEYDKSIGGDSATIKYVSVALADHVSKLCGFLGTHDLGVMKVTVAGQSMQAYRHKFGPRREVTYHITRGKNKGKIVTEKRLWPRLNDTEDSLFLARKSYYGGPTHCFYIGNVSEPVYVLDVRSLYPNVMAYNQYPSEFINIDYNPSNECVIERLCHECGIARVSINSGWHSFPLRKKIGTYYVSGKFDTFLAGPELQRAFDTGSVEKVHEIAWYKPMDLFSKYVHYLYSVRCEAEINGYQTWADIAKMLLNCLGGKFGQMYGDFQDDDTIPCEEQWGYFHGYRSGTNEGVLCRGIAGNTQALNGKVEAKYAFPAISAYICSYGRIHMANMFEFCHNTGKLFYSATDSLHVNEPVYDYLGQRGMIGNELGQLRLKTSGNSACYRGIGDYTIGNEITRSGLPGTSQPACNYCKGDSTISDGRCNDCDCTWDGQTWSYLQSESASEIIGHGPQSGLLSRKMFITLPSHYRFARVCKNGWTIPYRFGYDNGPEIQDIVSS